MTNTTPTSVPDELDDEIDLIDLAITLGEEKKQFSKLQVHLLRLASWPAW